MGTFVIANGEFRVYPGEQSDRERVFGGEGGIRTPGTR